MVPSNHEHPVILLAYPFINVHLAAQWPFVTSACDRHWSHGCVMGMIPNGWVGRTLSFVATNMVSYLKGRAPFTFFQFWAIQGGSQRSLWTMSHCADTVEKPLSVSGTLQCTLKTTLDVGRDNLTSHIWEIRFLLFPFLVLLEQDKC